MTDLFPASEILSVLVFFCSCSIETLALERPACVLGRMVLSKACSVLRFSSELGSLFSTLFSPFSFFFFFFFCFSVFMFFFSSFLFRSLPLRCHTLEYLLFCCMYSSIPFLLLCFRFSLVILSTSSSFSRFCFFFSLFSLIFIFIYCSVTPACK